MQGGRKKLQFPTNISNIARKWLKIDGCMVLYTAMHLTIIESSFYPCNIYLDCHRGVPREEKMCKKSSKMANFQTYGLNYWETVEDRCNAFAAMLQCF